jgi:hypothetical protein
MQLGFVAELVKPLIAFEVILSSDDGDIPCLLGGVHRGSGFRIFVCMYGVDSHDRGP